VCKAIKQQQTHINPDKNQTDRETIGKENFIRK
jgi:hypothetical protein